MSYVTLHQVLVTVKVTDGVSEIEQSTDLIVTQRADLWVQSIDILNQNTGDSTVSEGNAIEIYDAAANSEGVVVATIVLLSRCFRAVAAPADLKSLVFRMDVRRAQPEPRARTGDGRGDGRARWPAPRPRATAAAR